MESARARALAKASQVITTAAADETEPLVLMAPGRLLATDPRWADYLADVERIRGLSPADLIAQRIESDPATPARFGADGRARPRNGSQGRQQPDAAAPGGSRVAHRGWLSHGPGRIARQGTGDSCKRSCDSCLGSGHYVAGSRQA